MIDTNMYEEQLEDDNTERCKTCECVLNSNWDGDGDYCCWCVERIEASE